MGSQLTIPKAIDPILFNDLLDQSRADNAPLMPRASVEIILPALAGSMTKATADEASECAVLMIGAYPSHNAAEPQLYARAIQSAFAEYPKWMGQKVVDRITRKKKFLPTRADVLEYLEEEAVTIRTAIAKAEWILREHARRDVLRQHEARVEADKAAFREKHGDRSPMEVLGSALKAAPK
jgi:hypothetical protein